MWVILPLVLAACGDGGPPAIAQDLNLGIGTSQRWPARLSQQFPTGTPQSKVISTLQSQGFTVDQGKRTAKLKWSEGVCDHSLEAAWEVDAEGNITDIDGEHWPACL
ncbi:hypothetical protein [Brevundimonas sp. GCM10030266]|uniref:hypothetical protein n=1 Tax=Brevundimonas sp. GCM10030266 TaxID=3273386 RepID=UPI0036112101